MAWSKIKSKILPARQTVKLGACQFAVPRGVRLRFACAVRSHETTATVRFGDCDPAGVIFYPRAFELAHAAVEEFLRAAIGGNAWFASPVYAFPIRRAEADFLAPMKPGEVFRAALSVERLGTTSMTFVVEFTDSAAQLAARIRTVHVAVDRTSGKAASIPPEVLSKLS
jgi:4-hydroxybenzoyl-CoA thioesterase